MLWQRLASVLICPWACGGRKPITKGHRTSLASDFSNEQNGKGYSDSGINRRRLGSHNRGMANYPRDMQS